MFLNVLFIVLQLYNYATNNKEDVFGQDVTYENIESFSWEIAKNHTKETMPSVLTIPDGLMPDTRKIRNQQVRGKKGHKRWIFMIFAV